MVQELYIEENEKKRKYLKRKTIKKPNTVYIQKDGLKNERTQTHHLLISARSL